MLSIFPSYNNHRKIILFLSLGWRYRIKICRTKRHNKTKPGQWFSHTGYNSTAPAFCLEEQPCLLILLSRGPVCLKSSVRRSSMTHTYVVFRLLYGLLLFFVLGFLLVPGWQTLVLFKACSLELVFPYVIWLFSAHRGHTGAPAC